MITITINGIARNYYECNGGDEITLGAVGTSGETIRYVTWTMRHIYPVDVIFPELTLSGVAPGETATFTMPSNAKGVGIRIEAKVNNEPIKSVVVSAKSSSGTYPIAPYESTESGINGWLERMNNQIQSGSVPSTFDTLNIDVLTTTAGIGDATRNAIAGNQGSQGESGSLGGGLTLGDGYLTNMDYWLGAGADSSSATSRWQWIGKSALPLMTLSQSGTNTYGTLGIDGRLSIKDPANQLVAISQYVSSGNAWIDLPGIAYLNGSGTSINLSVGSSLFTVNNAGASINTKMTSPVFASNAATVASTGVVRLGNTETISSRNAAGTANVDLIALDSTDTINIGNSNSIGLTTNGTIKTVSDTCSITLRSATDGASYGSVFLGASNLTPSSTNYSIKSNGSMQFYNASTLHDYRISAVAKMQVSSTYIYSYVPALNFTNTVSSPTISQLDTSTASATGQTMTLQAQNATGTTSTGGNVNITSGTGTTAAGNVNMQTGGTTRLQVTPTYISLGAANATNTGLIRAPYSQALFHVRNYANNGSIFAIEMSGTDDNMYFGDNRVTTNKLRAGTSIALSIGSTDVVSVSSALTTINSTTVDIQSGGTSRIKTNGTGIGFYNASPVAKPTVTGSRGSNAALASLLTQLATLGLITDSTTS